MQTFDCSNPNESVHFKFDRFDTEYEFDYLVIGYPTQFDNYYDAHFGSVDHDFEIPTFRTGLMLHGHQQTDIWVNAESIPMFNIYFVRNATKIYFTVKILKVYVIFSKYSQVITSSLMTEFEWLLNVEPHHLTHQLFLIFMNLIFTILIITIIKLLNDFSSL